MKMRILLLFFTSTSLFAMEPMPRKRGMQEAVEQEGQKAQRVSEEISYPLASLPGLPNELQLLVTQNLLNAPGENDNYKLLNAATNIRNLFSINNRYKELLDDVDLTGKIVMALAQRYTNNDLVHAAITFNTNAASIWLAQQIKQQLFTSDGEKRALPLLQSNALKLYNDLQQALDFAVNNNRVDILRFLITYQPRLANWQVNAIKDNEEEDRLPLLEVALYKENPEMVRTLLKAGAKITDATVSSAAANRTTFALEQLRAAGVNLNARYDGESLFHFANNEQVIAYLVAQGADINVENNKGLTALQDALYKSQFTIANLLLAYGADPNIQNEFGDTALHSALIKKAPRETIAMIVNKITNLEIANADGNTPLALAILAFDRASIELLLSRGAQLPPVIYESGTQANVLAISPLAFILRMAGETDPDELIKIVELLLAYGANPNEMIRDQNTGNEITLLSRMKNDRLSWTPVFLNLMAMLKAYGGQE